MARTPSKKAPAPTDKAPTPGKDAAEKAASTPAGTPPSPTGDQGETPTPPSNEQRTPEENGDELAQAQAEVTRLAAEHGLDPQSITPDDLNAEGPRRELADAIKRVGSLVKPGDAQAQQQARPGQETDRAAADANDPARKLAEQRQGDPAALAAADGNLNTNADAMTAAVYGQPGDQQTGTTSVTVQLADAVALMTPQEQAEYYRAKLAELENHPGHIDPGDGLAITAAKLADNSPASTQQADQAAAVMAAQQKAARVDALAASDQPRSLSADLARLNELAQERAAKGPQIDRSVSQAARQTIGQERAQMDAATQRAKFVSGQAYGGLVGGEYALNPADATNRARVALGVPAALIRASRLF